VEMAQRAQAPAPHQDGLGVPYSTYIVPG